MKKLATPPQSASNHRFHSYGWSRASNYVAKAYMKDDGTVDCSEDAKAAVQNDIVLQHEADRWATKFNDTRPPKSIIFIRAYAIEFPNRPGSPWYAVERFIAGKDSYGAGFVKHNTNSGFVDLDLHRTTPQVFSAFSFYASQGRRLVADIQGVGDLYTDPQVLSSDYRFGDGDLGPRGMALFFQSFRHCSYSDVVGIPIFALSKNELKHQAKYNEDDLTLSDDEREDDEGEGMTRLDLNRLRRNSVFQLPTDFGKPEEERDTLRRSNLQNNHADIRKSIRVSLRQQAVQPVLARSKSDADEVTHSLITATMDAVFDHKTFHRKASGEYRERSTESHRAGNLRKTLVPTDSFAAPPMVPCYETKANLGKVHYQLACLHGMGRFPEMMEGGEVADVPSIIFHLSHACSLRNVPACLSMGRVRAGLDTTVSPLLRSTVPVDFDAAKELFQRAMESDYSSSKPKAAAGCLLLQILHEEEGNSNAALLPVLEETLAFMKEAEKEDQELEVHTVRMKRGGGVLVGDRVDANYSLEGSYYAAVVTGVDGESITVQYDDDDSSETHNAENVRPLIPQTATRDCGGPLSDAEALGGENDDEKCILEDYSVKAELAELLAKMGEAKEAAALFEEAADGAMNAGKMKSASEWSSKASDLAA
jgi:elongation factor 2 kinase